MMNISKYCDTVEDYKNIEKCCKKYRGITEQFHYNPIPIYDANVFKIFKNIETYHIYDAKQVKSTRKNIKKKINWYKCVPYSDSSNNDDNVIYKHVILKDPIIPIPEKVTEINKY